MSVLEGYIERTAKYTNKWAKRYATYDPSTKKLAYRESKDKPDKSVVFLKSVTRCAETNELKPNSKDLFAMVVDGKTTEDGREEKWTIRFPDGDVFEAWYTSMRTSLAAAGLMEPLHFGLPDIDPRSGLEFRNIPVRYLRNFKLFERSIVFFCDAIYIHPYAEEFVFLIGDRHVYVFQQDTETFRCFSVSSLVSMKTVKAVPTAAQPQQDYLALKLQAPQHDLVVSFKGDKDKKNMDDVVHVLCTLYRAITRGTELPVTDVKYEVGIEEYVKTDDLVLMPHADYVLEVVAPTAKSRLKQALDVHERKTGVVFAPNSKEASPSGALGTTSASAVTKRKSEDRIVVGDDPLSQLLAAIRLTQYIAPLKRQHVDLDVLGCMEPNDLANFGVSDPNHREAIIEAVTNGVPTTTAGSPTRVIVDLDDSLEDVSPPAHRPVINLDDSDDDLQVPMHPQSRTNVVVDLDSDDDLDVVMPQKGTVAPTAIVLPDSDDDDL